MADTIKNVSMNFTLTDKASVEIKKIEALFDSLQKRVTEVNGQLAAFGTSGAVVARGFKETATESDAVDFSLRNQVNAYRALHKAMVEDEAIARNSAIQQRIFNSLLRSGAEEASGETIALAKQAVELKNLASAQTEVMATSKMMNEAQRLNRIEDEAHGKKISGGILDDYYAREAERKAENERKFAELLANRQKPSTDSSYVAEDRVRNAANMQRQVQKLYDDMIAVGLSRDKALKAIEDNFGSIGIQFTKTLRQSAVEQERIAKELSERKLIQQKRDFEEYKIQNAERKRLDAEAAERQAIIEKRDLEEHKARTAEKLSTDKAAAAERKRLDAEAAARQAIIEKRDYESWLARGAAERTRTNSTAVRELFVMLRELSRGDMTRFAGSLSIELNAMNVLSTLLKPQVLALEVAVGLLGYAFVKGASEAAEMNNALVKTGNFAGMTSSQMRNLAQETSNSSRMTIGAAKELVTQLVASGQFGADAISHIASVADSYAKASGKSVKEITPELIKMFSDPAKGAEELNRSMHFLNGSQLEHITHLTHINQEEKAAVELADALRSHLDGLTDGVIKQDGFVNKLEKSWSSFIDKLSRGVTGTETAADELEAAQTRLARIKRGGFGTGDEGSVEEAQIDVGIAQNRLALENFVKQSKARMQEKAAKASKSDQDKFDFEKTLPSFKIKEIETETIPKLQDFKKKYVEQLAGADAETRRDLLTKIKETEENIAAEQRKVEDLKRRGQLRGMASTGAISEDQLAQLKAQWTQENKTNIEILQGTVKFWDDKLHTVRTGAERVSIERKRADAERQLQVAKDKETDQITAANEKIAFNMQKRDLENQLSEIKAKRADDTISREDAAKQELAAREKIAGLELAQLQARYKRLIDEQKRAEAILVQGEMDIINADLKAAEQRQPDVLKKAGQEDAKEHYKKAVESAKMAMPEKKLQELQNMVGAGLMGSSQAAGLEIELKRQAAAEAYNKLLKVRNDLEKDDRIGQAEKAKQMDELDKLILKTQGDMTQLTQGAKAFQSVFSGAIDKFLTSIESQTSKVHGTINRLKVAAESFFTSIVSGITKIVNQKITENITAQIMGALGLTGGNTGGGSSPLGGIGNILGNLLGPSSMGGGSGAPIGGGGGSIANMISFLTGNMSFASGADYIPRDMIAQIHKGEMILPSATADLVRQGLTSSASGGSSPQFNFSIPPNTTAQTQYQIVQSVYRGMMLANGRG